MTLSIFSYVYLPSVCPLWRSVYSGPLPILLIGLFGFFGVEFYKFLQILGNNPLSIVSLMNMFSHSFSCLFILLMVSFSVQNLFSLMKYHLFIFFLLFPFPGEIYQKKILLQAASEILLPLFSSMIFMVFSLNSTCPIGPNGTVSPITQARYLRYTLHMGWVHPHLVFEPWLLLAGQWEGFTQASHLQWLAMTTHPQPPPSGEDLLCWCRVVVLRSGLYPSTGCTGSGVSWLVYSKVSHHLCSA